MKTAVQLAFEKEIAEAKEARDATPEGQKVLRLEGLLADYLGKPQPASRPVVVRADASFRGAGRARSPERQAILDECLRYLRAVPPGAFGTVPPHKTRWILQHLQTEGISVPGTDPVSNLSAMLSNSPWFVAHGRRGWTLAGNENPADAGIPEEESVNGDVEDGIDHAVEPLAQGREAGPGGGT